MLRFECPPVLEPETKSAFYREVGRFNHKRVEWLDYYDRIDRFMETHCLWIELEKKEILLCGLGEKTLLSIIRPLNIQDIDYELIVERIENYFYPYTDRQYYLKKFNLRRQKIDESFFEYVCALRKLMLNCNFTKKTKFGRLRYQLINGCCSDLKRNINHNAMSLSQVFEAGILWDQSSNLKPRPNPRNHRARKNRTPKCFRCKQDIREVHNGEPCPFEWAICSSCSIKGHVSLACKYKDVICNKCGMKGHVARICKKKEGIP